MSDALTVFYSGLKCHTVDRGNRPIGRTLPRRATRGRLRMGSGVGAEEDLPNGFSFSPHRLLAPVRAAIESAGLTPWPKLFQNLRATRETELGETFPIHVVCKWIGNTEAVARKHYLQVTDADYEKAQKASRGAATGAAIR
jgi:hypothetical protein